MCKVSNFLAAVCVNLTQKNRNIWWHFWCSFPWKQLFKCTYGKNSLATERDGSDDGVRMERDGTQTSSWPDRRRVPVTPNHGGTEQSWADGLETGAENLAQSHKHTQIPPQKREKERKENNCTGSVHWAGSTGERRMLGVGENAAILSASLSVTRQSQRSDSGTRQQAQRVPSGPPRHGELQLFSVGSKHSSGSQLRGAKSSSYSCVHSFNCGSRSNSLLFSAGLEGGNGEKMSFSFTW